VAGVGLQLLFPPSRRRSLLRRAFLAILFLGHACGNPDPDRCIPAGTRCEPHPDGGSDAPAYASASGGSGGSDGSAGWGTSD
jgi:hypothetical protein